MDSTVDIHYCGKKCPIGQEESYKLLSKNNSAYDAAMDFVWFTEECFRTCPFKDKHTKQDKKP